MTVKEENDLDDYLLEAPLIPKIPDYLRRIVLESFERQVEEIKEEKNVLRIRDNFKRFCNKFRSRIRTRNFGQR